MRKRICLLYSYPTYPEFNIQDGDPRMDANEPYLAPCNDGGRGAGYRKALLAGYVMSKAGQSSAFTFDMKDAYLSDAILERSFITVELEKFEGRPIQPNAAGRFPASIDQP